MHELAISICRCTCMRVKKKYLLTVQTPFYIACMIYLHHHDHVTFETDCRFWSIVLYCLVLILFLRVFCFTHINLNFEFSFLFLIFLNTLHYFVKTLLKRIENFTTDGKCKHPVWLLPNDLCKLVSSVDEKMAKYNGIQSTWTPDDNIHRIPFYDSLKKQ